MQMGSGMRVYGWEIFQVWKWTVTWSHCTDWGEVRAAVQQVCDGPLALSKLAASRLSLLLAHVKARGEAGDGATAASQQEAATFARDVRDILGLRGVRCEVDGSFKHCAPADLVTQSF